MIPDKFSVRIVVSQWPSKPAEYNLTFLRIFSKIRQTLETGTISHPFGLFGDLLGLLTMDPLYKGAYLAVLYSKGPPPYNGPLLQKYTHPIVLHRPPLSFLLKLPLSCPCEWLL